MREKQKIDMMIMMRTSSLIVAAALVILCTTAYAENGAHAYLLSVSPKQQAATLGKVVGDGCVGTKAFNMGIGSTNIGNWSVKCADGRSFVVGANPDGTSKVLECSVYKLVTKLSCFKKLEGTH
jgi:hypothetical protein